MGHDAEIGFGVVPWDAQAEQELGQIADASEHLDSWRQAWAEGRAQLWAMADDKGRIGCVLWEVTFDDGAPHIHVMAAATTKGQVGATDALYRAFTALKRAVGAAAVYCETMRPGLKLLLVQKGCDAVQIEPGKWGVRYV